MDEIWSPAKFSNPTLEKAQNKPLHLKETKKMFCCLVCLRFKKDWDIQFILLSLLAWVGGCRVGIPGEDLFPFHKFSVNLCLLNIGQTSQSFYEKEQILEKQNKVKSISGKFLKVLKISFWSTLSPLYLVYSSFFPST